MPPAISLGGTWPCYVSATCRSTSKSSLLQQRSGGRLHRLLLFPDHPSFLSLMRQGGRIVFGVRLSLWNLGKEEFCVKVRSPAPQNGEEDGVLMPQHCSFTTRESSSGQISVLQCNKMLTRTGQSVLCPFLQTS